jgi:hypothetical protein
LEHWRGRSEGAESEGRIKGVEGWRGETVPHWRVLWGWGSSARK